MGIRSDKRLWWCCRPRAPIILRIDDMIAKFPSSRVLDCLGVITQHDWDKILEISMDSQI